MVWKVLYMLIMICSSVVSLISVPCSQSSHIPLLSLQKGTSLNMHTHIFICHFLTLWFKIEGGAKLEHLYNKRTPYDGSHCIPSYGKGCLLKVVEAWGSSHWWIAFSHELYHLSKLTQYYVSCFLPTSLLPFVIIISEPNHLWNIS